jgi:hypothetical protein
MNKGRRRIVGPFDVTPSALNIPFKLEGVWRFLFNHRDRETDECEMPNRRMMRKFGMTERTIQNYTRILAATPWLEKIEDRLPGKKRSRHNRYRFPHLQRCNGAGGGEKICGEMQLEKALTTTTPAPTAAGLEVKPTITPKPSIPALQWALRKANDAIASLRMRSEYADRGKLWLHKARERNSAAMGTRNAIMAGSWDDRELPSVTRNDHLVDYLKRTGYYEKTEEGKR